MLIEDLSHDAFKLLYAFLNDGVGTDYKALMTKRFSDLYSLAEVTEIEKSKSPAKKLLCDLINRQITVERLLEEVEAIGNIKAVKIIMEANIEFENIYTDVTKRGIILNLPGDYQFSPRHSTGQPQEHTDAVLMQYPIWEQDKTYYKAPVPETVFNPSH